MLINTYRLLGAYINLLTYNLMKTARTTSNKQSKQGLSKKPRPEIRDDMDSRKQNRSRL
jgi:hypothetical protein